MSTHAFSSPSAGAASALCPARPLRAGMVKRRNAFVHEFRAYTDDPLRTMFEDSGPAAAHGTYLHSQLENLLVDGVAMEIDDAFERDGMEHIAAKINAEREVALEFHAEERLHNYGVDSGGTVDTIFLHDSTKYGLDLEVFSDVAGEVGAKWLHLPDLKTGRVEVHAENNEQLKRYACGAMARYNWDEDITHIMLSIYAFRFPSSSWVISREDLMDYWVNDFRVSMWHNNAINPQAIAGDLQCQYCEAAGVCPESLAFSGKELPDGVIDGAFGNISTVQLEEVYAQVSTAANAVEKVKAELLLRESTADFNPDNALTGYKRKNGAKRSFYKDEKGVAALVNKIDGAIVSKPAGASALRKLLKGDEHKELLETVNELIVDSQNKPSLIKAK